MQKNEENNRRSVTEKPTSAQSSAVQETTKLPLSEEDLIIIKRRSFRETDEFKQLITQSRAALQLQRRVKELEDLEADLLALHKVAQTAMNGNSCHIMRIEHEKADLQKQVRELEDLVQLINMGHAKLKCELREYEKALEWLANHVYTVVATCGGCYTSNGERELGRGETPLAAIQSAMKEEKGEV